MSLLFADRGHAGGAGTVSPSAVPPAQGVSMIPGGPAPHVAKPDRMPSGEQAMCIPADEGRLDARLRGAINAEIRWAAPMPQCRGGVRPDANGVRLVYKGVVPDSGPLLFVIGIGPLQPGMDASNVPANITLVREGSGIVFATQGNDKCSVDDLRQALVPGSRRTYRITGRGYCTQPARAIAGDGVVVVSRFDFGALVDYP